MASDIDKIVEAAAEHIELSAVLARKTLKDDLTAFAADIRKAVLEEVRMVNRAKDRYGLTVWLDDELRKMAEKEITDGGLPRNYCSQGELLDAFPEKFKEITDGE